MKQLRMPALVLSLAVATACGGSTGGQMTDSPSAGDSTGARLTLPRLVADPPLEGTRIAGVRISPDARWLTFLRGSEADSEVLDLWGLSLEEKNAKPKPLVRATDILGSEDEELSEEERMARERKRIRVRGLVSYRFCGDQGHDLLFTLGGDLYHVRPTGDKPEVTRLTSDGGAKLDSRCSPGATQASYVKDGEVHAVDIARKKHTQLTRGASKERRHGVAEFVAQEEMGRYDGHWWSKNDRYLAYTDVDLSPVSVKMRPRIHADRTELVEQRYPATGEDNAIVKVRVLDLKSGEGVLLDTPKEDGYIARVNWFGDSDLYVQWQSRDQRRIVLYRGKAPRFALEQVLEEKDEAWTELHHDLRVLKSGALIWPSETSGVRQLYRVEADGTRTALTSGGDAVTSVAAVNEETGLLYYVKATNRARERHLFSVPLEGGEEKQLTTGPGIHGISGHREGRAFVETYSDLTTPWMTRVLSPEGKTLHVLDDGSKAPWHKVALPKSEWVTVTAEDGTQLNGLLVHPLKRSGERSPVIIYVYGGPGAQIVSDSFGSMSSFSVYLAQQGFGVFMLDNRGMANRDRAFSRVLYQRMADIEVRDQLAGVDYLKSLDWVDPDRLGVWGWSYGGTMSALLITEENSPLRAAVSGAPVTDWRLYDTHYTERYLGKPQDHPEVYERTDVVRRATRLKKPLLLIHGTADDNVLFENSLRLIQEFQKNSIPFETMIYPGHAHGVRGREARLHLLRMIVRFFARELGVAVDPSSL